MLKKRYPAIAVLGGEKISALYGVDNGIVDWQGIGIQHFFYESYQYDLIHSGVTYLKHSNHTVELGNRKIDGKSHPLHQHPKEVKTIDGYLYQTRFQSQKIRDISWVEAVYATQDNGIIFETEVFNEGEEPYPLELGCYVILRNPGAGRAEKTNMDVLWQGRGGALKISLQGAQVFNINTEAPTGFIYRTLQMLRGGYPDTSALQANTFIGVTMGRHVKVPPHGSVRVRWGIAASGSIQQLQRHRWDWQYERKKASRYWQGWIENEVYQRLKPSGDVKCHYEANLVAIKGAILNGFVPADITGHYFSHGSPCYYARDAMMIARAFLLSGHYSEARDIINYLIQRPTKNNSGEFYQRYNALGEPSEGANNNVPHQLDSQGYFLRNIYTYFQRTGQWLLSLEQVKPYVEVLRQCIGPSGLVGPEGGVNEGVFGPAYITSSNMFIYGGLMAAIEMAKIHGEPDTAAQWREMAETIDGGIQSTWVEREERYGYGYVLYGPEIVKKYDTPQYFGTLYGYPINERVAQNNEFFLKYSTFFENGIGYTEQEYHHGPWLFNTGACAQYQALVGKVEQYLAKLNWMMEHSNGYGLMPEAIDAENEDHAFINPLTWACAEFVSTVSILATKDGFRPGKLKGFDGIVQEVK
ncbi:glycoside hydrolase family 15 protein [Alkaliphilus crotonatoxidans]